MTRRTEWENKPEEWKNELKETNENVKLWTKKVNQEMREGEYHERISHPYVGST